MLKFPLRSGVSIAVFLALVIEAALMLGLYAVRYAAARELIDTDNLERASWAVRLDPQNALVQNRAGFLYQWQTPALRRRCHISSARLNSIPMWPPIGPT